MTDAPVGARGRSALRLLGAALVEDLGVLRTRVFVGLANLLPDLDVFSLFARPVLLRLAGARVGFPSRIRPPLYVHAASGIEIGRWAFINQGCRIEGRKRVSIGESALIGPFCLFENVNHRPEGPEGLPITVGRGAWIGAGCILLPGAVVGDGAVVGAGSVVRGEIPAGETWAGVPARPLRPATDAVGSRR
jgi:acetyltransferase-like isoleucine patch superfamily enzyme